MFNQKTIKNKPKTSKAQPLDSIPSFIRKTYEILEENKFPEYIDWNQEGTAIIIKMPSEFSQKVLPTYFKHNNLTSFVRQLNMYNFHKKRTQNLDHIYFHELFQRGKKHLLKEIKRKNHETQLQNPEKSPVLFHTQSNITDTLSESQTPGDMNSLSYENQFLRRLYNDAMSKAASLESQVKELTAHNQSLWSQLCKVKQPSTPALTHSTASSFNSRRESVNLERMHPDLTLEQLPMTMGDVCIPPLKLDNIMNDNQQFNTNLRININASNGDVSKNPTVNVNSYLSFEESTNSSDGSPSLHHINNRNGSEKEIDNNEQNHAIPQLNGLGITPQTSLVNTQRGYNNGNLLKISRQDLSLGQMLENWGEEQVDLAFGDQKENANTANYSANMLGKRGLEVETRGVFGAQEPSLKRSHYDQMGMFCRKGNSSIGNDEKDMLQLTMRRESEFNEDCDMNGNIDLMDFNGSGLYSWTKSM